METRIINRIICLKDITSSMQSAWFDDAPCVIKTTNVNEYISVVVRNLVRMEAKCEKFDWLETDFKDFTISEPYMDESGCEVVRVTGEAILKKYN